MSSLPMTEEHLANVIKREVERLIEVAIGAEIAEAQKRIEQAVRREIGVIALRVLANYDISTRGTELLIKVRTQ